MNRKTNRGANSTRRSFLKSGALLAAPLVPAAVMAGDDLHARLAKLENEAAIRELHQNWLRGVNTGAGDASALFANPDRAVRGIAADHAGERDAIEVASNGRSATGRFHCTVEIESAIPQDSTLARMAHAQGGGFVRWNERRVLHVEYVKAAGAWAIAKAEFAPSEYSQEET